jgi:glycosyltransferase involved in cell wall biosynthesis/protein-L-isoaspartate O-methyltransferase
MTKRLLSILVPLYNEEELIGTLLRRVLDAQLPEGLDREIVVVDDGSTDDSVEIVQALVRQHPNAIHLIRHDRNQGKGAAIRTAIENARGEFSIIQDADLEYDPREYSKMLRPLLTGEADAVYGSRFLVSGERRVLYYWHSLANRILTECCNIAADVNLTDMETCYKAFVTSLVRSIPIRSNRFGIEPELTIKLARRQARIYEVPISYHGRTYEEGKKIGLADAFQALWVILRYSIIRDIYREAGPDILDALAGTVGFNKWMAETVLPYVGSRVLEVGAGIGNLTLHLARRRKRYVAGDIDEKHLARLKTRFQDRPHIGSCYLDLTNPLDFAPFAGQMDTVVCLNVLEHIQDDLLGLRNIYSALEPGGRAIVLVPQGQEIYGTLDEALGHYRRYSQEDLSSRMVAAGFVIERILEFNRITRPAWYVNGKIFKRTTFNRLQLKVFDRFVWLWRQIDGALPWPPTSIIAIGRKALA